MYKVMYCTYVFCRRQFIEFCLFYIFKSGAYDGAYLCVEYGVQGGWCLFLYIFCDDDDAYYLVLQKKKACSQA